MSRKNSKENKAIRREERAAHKNQTTKEEKSSKPNNVLLGVLIFGIIAAMFIVGHGIKYFQKEATIESFLKSDETYAEQQLDSESTMRITAKRNKMNVELEVNTEDKKYIKEVEDYYTGEDGTKNMKYFGAYQLSSIKPETRAIYADCHVSVKLNDEEIAKTDLTCFDADRIVNGTYYNDLEKDTEKEKSKDTKDETSEETSEETEDEETALDVSSGQTIEVDADGNAKVIDND